MRIIKSLIQWWKVAGYKPRRPIRLPHYPKFHDGSPICGWCGKRMTRASIGFCDAECEDASKFD